MMQPETRFAMTLGVSLALWAPTLIRVVHGETALAQALGWYVVALIVAWAAVAGLDHLVAGYAATNERRDDETRVAAARQVAADAKAGPTDLGVSAVLAEGGVSVLPGDPSSARPSS